MKTWAHALAGLVLAALLLPARSAPMEDGYDLWMRYRPLRAADQQQVLAQARSLYYAEPASTCPGPNWAAKAMRCAASNWVAAP